MSTYAPDDLMACLNLMNAHGAPWSTLGCVGDDAHVSSGGYHIGRNTLVNNGRGSYDYSLVESTRDSSSRTDGASAIDFGDQAPFWRELTLWLVDACQRSAPGTECVREIIYTPDGTWVSRWDRLGIRSTGDSSHLWHTHVSFFRDSEGSRQRQDFFQLLQRFFAGDSAFQTASAREDDEYSMNGELNCGTLRTMVTGDFARGGLAKNGPAWLVLFTDPALIYERGVKKVDLRVALTDAKGWNVPTVTLSDGKEGRPGWVTSIELAQGWFGARIDRMGLKDTPDPDDPEAVASKEYDPVAQIEIGWCLMYGPKTP
jgi:hypothetical protein